MLVVSQAFAHVRAPPRRRAGAPGARGALALHLALALAAALVGIERRPGALSAALAGLSDAVGRLLELLAALPAARSAAPPVAPRAGPAARLPLGRAPPLAA